MLNISFNLFLLYHNHCLQWGFFFLASAGKDVIGEALYSVVMQLIEDISAIPTPLSMFFRAAQDRVYEKPIRSPHNSVALKAGHILKNRLLPSSKNTYS